jgi:outer membrane protein TolC
MKPEEHPVKHSWMAPALLLVAVPLGCQAVDHGPRTAWLAEIATGRPAPAAGVVRASARLLPPEAAGSQDRLLPASRELDLEAALTLAGAENPTIALAREAVQASLALQLQAQALLLPTLSGGANYNWHNGTLQNGQGAIIDVERQSAYVGAGAVAVGAGTVVNPGVSLTVQLADAIYEPRAARFAVTGRQFDAQATNNNVLLEVATGYFALVGAEARLQALRRSEEDFAEIVAVTKRFAETKQGRDADYERARTEALLLHAAVERMEEEVAVAAAELARLLNLDASIPLRAPAIPVPLLELVDPHADLEQLVQIALANRPEIAARSANVAVAETLLRKEKVRPLLPTLAIGYSAGGFGGGGNQADTQFGHFSGRSDFDVAAFWTLDGFGFGNLAAQRRVQAKVGEANAERLRTIDAIGQEVAEAFALVAARRRELDIARRRTQTSLGAFQQDMKRAKNLEGRAIEVLDSAKLLNTARQDVIGALIGYNQAQLQLFVALGQPPTLMPR